MAKYGVKIVEIYNEPDKDECMGDAAKWAEHLRIRSHAVQDAYEDQGTAGGNRIVPEIYAPTTAGAWHPVYSAATLTALNVPFPGDSPSPDWKAATGYSFHRYGDFSPHLECSTFSAACKPEGGYGIRRAVDSIYPYLANAGLSSMPVGVSECNCYTSATADTQNRTYFRGRHIMDLPSTAACLAGQIAGFSTSNKPPPFVSVHKMVQNLALDRTNTLSKISKIGKLS